VCKQAGFSVMSTLAVRLEDDETPDLCFTLSAGVINFPLSVQQCCIDVDLCSTLLLCLCPRGALWNSVIAMSVYLSVPWLSCLSCRHAGCLQLCHSWPPEMCILWTRPHVDAPQFLPPSNCDPWGHIVSLSQGRYIVSVCVCVCVCCLQLKHCGKQVCELMLTLVKNLDFAPAEHLLSLMSQLEPSAHSEQVMLPYNWLLHAPVFSLDGSVIEYLTVDITILIVRFP